jgi:hypothetical protein
MGRVTVELLIVFVGVYSAFLLDDWQTARELRRERDRITALLQLGIERYQKLFEGFVLRHETVNADFRAALESGSVPDFGDTFYPAPQYPIEMIRHVLTRESYDVFSIDAYVPLTTFVNSLERLMDVEAKLVALSSQWDPLPPANHPDRDWLRARAVHRAKRYLTYLDIRMRISADLQKQATELRQLLASAG